MRIITATVLVSSLLIAGAVTLASEKKIAMKDVPPAVQQAIKEQSGGATVRGLAKEVEKGQTLYEAELKVNGHSKDITFDDHGTIVSVEEEIALDQIPAAARTAIEKAAGTGKTSEVEKVTEGGKTFYEAQVNKGGKKFEVKVDASGVAVK
jgi:uncharacterized membrane protein YkoI